MSTESVEHPDEVAVRDRNFDPFVQSIGIHFVDLLLAAARNPTNRAVGLHREAKVTVVPRVGAPPGVRLIVGGTSHEHAP